jgi:TRAP transporter TAXI family solute receptor
VTLGTATPGGGFPVYGQAVADTINEVDATLDVRPHNTKGSTENVPLLEAGSLDLALVQGEVVHGRSPSARAGGPARPRRDVFHPGMFVVRADAPYRSIDDLKGARSRSGRADQGSSSSRYVLDARLDRDRDFQAVLLDAAGDGPAMVMDGRAAALWGGGGWPGFTAVARGPAGARFLVRISTASSGSSASTRSSS